MSINSVSPHGIALTHEELLQAGFTEADQQDPYVVRLMDEYGEDYIAMTLQKKSYAIFKYGKLHEIHGRLNKFLEGRPSTTYYLCSESGLPVESISGEHFKWHLKQDYNMSKDAYSKLSDEDQGLIATNYTGEYLHF